MPVEKLGIHITKGENGRTVHETPIVNLNAAEAESVGMFVKSFK
jgi:hypothetical protein